MMDTADPIGLPKTKIRKNIIMCLVFASLMLQSCYSFETVSIARKGLPGIDEKTSDKAPALERNFPREYGRAAHRVSVKKFLARMRFSSPVALINDRGVDLSLQERHAEAEILFKEVIAEDLRSGAGYNNLGVIHEFRDNLDEALRMYKAACSLEPGNRYFRDNLDSLVVFMRIKK
jgi:tetratricopeptide (TPR) repeat protein